MRKIILFLNGMLLLGVLRAQIPTNDPTWGVTMLDNFNSFNSAAWQKTYVGGNSVNNGAEITDPANVTFNPTTGWLDIEADYTPTPTAYNGKNYYYKGGVLMSKNAYKYGYYEISAKFPQGLGFWPAFWLYNQDNFTTCLSTDFYNEIDIVENGGLTSQYNNKIGYNMWYLSHSAATCSPAACCVISQFSTSTIPLGVPVTGPTTNEHKYAVLWLPGQAIYYYDDQEVGNVVSTTAVPSHPMFPILDFAIDPWNSPGTYEQTHNFPAHFQINYMKISQLQTSCSTVETFCSNFNKTMYDYKVKKSITFTGGCSTTINTSDNVTLYATDYILFDSGTQLVPNGTGAFFAMVTGSCPN